MLKSKMTFNFLGLVSIVAIILRTLLVINNTDDRGLYINEGSPIILIFNTLLIISTLVFLIIPMIDKMPEENRCRNKDKILGPILTILGGFIMFMGLVDFFVIIQLVGSNNWNDFRYYLMMTENGLMRLIISVITFITGWMVTNLSMIIISKKQTANRYGVAIMLAIWTIARAMLFTRSNTTIANIANNMYSMISIISAISFFLGFSKLMFGVDVKSGYRLSLVSGFITALYGMLASIPNYISFFLGKNLSFSIKDIPSIANLSISIFTVIFLFILTYSKGENKDVFN